MQICKFVVSFVLYESSKFKVKLKCKILKFNINANKVAKLHDTKKWTHFEDFVNWFNFTIIYISTFHLNIKCINCIHDKSWLQMNRFLWFTVRRFYHFAVEWKRDQVLPILTSSRDKEKPQETHGPYCSQDNTLIYNRMYNYTTKLIKSISYLRIPSFGKA